MGEAEEGIGLGWEDQEMIVRGCGVRDLCSGVETLLCGHIHEFSIGTNGVILFTLASSVHGARVIDVQFSRMSRYRHAECTALSTCAWNGVEEPLAAM